MLVIKIAIILMVHTKELLTRFYHYYCCSKYYYVLLLLWLLVLPLLLSTGTEKNLGNDVEGMLIVLQTILDVWYAESVLSEISFSWSLSLSQMHFFSTSTVILGIGVLQWLV